jgi:hypothetical protein
MRIKDLHGIAGFIWPPEWGTILEGSNEEWILSEVKLHKDQDPPYIYIEAVCDNDAQGGVIHLEPHEHLEILYQVLNKNIGKSLREIGDLKITF